jgi:hypothetical protein
MKKSLKISLMEDDFTIKSVVIDSIHARDMIDLSFHKINTYKIMREFLDCGLKDAKIMMDKLFESMVKGANSPQNLRKRITNVAFALGSEEDLRKLLQYGETLQELRNSPNYDYSELDTLLDEEPLLLKEIDKDFSDLEI